MPMVKFMVTVSLFGAAGSLILKGMKESFQQDESSVGMRPLHMRSLIEYDFY